MQYAARRSRSRAYHSYLTTPCMIRGVCGAWFSKCRYRGQLPCHVHVPNALCTVLQYRRLYPICPVSSIHVTIFIFYTHIYYNMQYAVCKEGGVGSLKVYRCSNEGSVWTRRFKAKLANSSFVFFPYHPLLYSARTLTSF